MARAAALLLLALASLVWADVLPGGWRLRGLLEPHAAREAREAREQARHFALRLERFARENPAVAKGAVVFLGSSTIERFPLEELFPGRQTVNRGVAQARCAELVRHLRQILPPARPGALIVYAAANERLALPGRPAEAVAQVEQLLDALAARLPGVPLLLLGPLPSRAMSVEQLSDLAAIEQGLERLASARALAFMALARPPFSTPSGALAEELSCDALHLNQAGYRALAARLREEGGAVAKLLAP